MGGPRLCISVAAATAGEALQKIEAARSDADVIEIRLDALDRGEITELLAKLESAADLPPLIATYRPAEQGGRELTRDQRVRFWTDPVSSFWAADVEEDVYEAAGAWPRRIISFHAPDQLWDLRLVFDRLSSTNADAVKIAVPVTDAAEALPVWGLLDRARSRGRQVVPIAMGEAGKWTRILGPAHGAFMSYASARKGAEMAAGQMTAHEMVEVYRVSELTPASDLYAVIGDPVSNSLSPYLHNAAFRAADKDAVFLPMQVRNVDAFFDRMVRKRTREVDLNFRGFAVTMPHKLSVLRHLDGVDNVAAMVGAVNTVAIEGGQLIGHNTDVGGSITPLKAALGSLGDVRVLVAGAGGAARACIVGLRGEGADVIVSSRDRGKAASLAAEFGVGSADLSDAAIAGTDVVVNATPVGMIGPLESQTLFTADQLSGVTLVYDLVTRCGGTPLMHEAEKAGVKTIGGAEMLIAQAEEQFTIWTGDDAPSGVMRAAAAAHL